MSGPDTPPAGGAPAGNQPGSSTGAPGAGSNPSGTTEKKTDSTETPAGNFGMKNAPSFAALGAVSYLVLSLL